MGLYGSGGQSFPGSNGQVRIGWIRILFNCFFVFFDPASSSHSRRKMHARRLTSTHVKPSTGRGLGEKGCKSIRKVHMYMCLCLCLTDTVLTFPPFSPSLLPGYSGSLAVPSPLPQVSSPPPIYPGLEGFIACLDHCGSNHAVVCEPQQSRTKPITVCSQHV